MEEMEQAGRVPPEKRLIRPAGGGLAVQDAQSQRQRRQSERAGLFRKADSWKEAEIPDSHVQTQRSVCTRGSGDASSL